MQIKTIKLNIQDITKECSRIPDEGLWTISSRFLWIRVEVPLWLSWLNTSVSKQSQAYNNKHKIYQAYKEISNVSMQDKNTSER